EGIGVLPLEIQFIERNIEALETSGLCIEDGIDEDTFEVVDGAAAKIGIGRIGDRADRQDVADERRGSRERRTVIVDDRQPLGDLIGSGGKGEETRVDRDIGELEALDIVEGVDAVIDGTEAATSTASTAAATPTDAAAPTANRDNVGNDERRIAITTENN